MSNEFPVEELLECTSCGDVLPYGMMTFLDDGQILCPDCYEEYEHSKASRRHFGKTLPNHQLQTVAAACGYDLTRHHHALADAEACAAIALKIMPLTEIL